MTTTRIILLGDKKRKRLPAPRTKWGMGAPYTALAIVGAFALIPVAWMIVTAATSEADVFQFPQSLAREYTLSNYWFVLTDPTLLGFVANGLLVSFVTCFCSLLVGFFAGYAFSKFRFRGRTTMMFLILTAQMVPQVLLLVTLYTAFDRVGMLDTYLALIISYTTFTLPLSVMMMKNSFDALPDALLEAARLDGASELRTMFSVMMPAVRTPMIAVCLFSFIRAWNDLPFALTLVDTERQTLPAGLSLMFTGEFQNAYGEMMAASIITSLPVVIIFFVLQKHFVSGALTGAVK
ncbi:carbohydrate ABC transporter permease [Leucobacter tenebrionis]|uniref:carbohydrate ABC transporter permease n=1 Tax=Leucobacter tenebrionis TaxID=2873270 RepID=UPI001CA76F52|nr:carbohydrate ABC transporter permease [Leucobacter tenebrionis]QZY53245.1 carbohydrate ABC transporter permease [Leucobacter tenebrionis]